MAAAMMTSPDVDTGDGLCTVQMSGGAPFGFRLSEDNDGRLIVSKVRVCVRVCVCRPMRRAIAQWMKPDLAHGATLNC